MSAVVFYLVLPILYIVSLLPFPVFYALSDGICFLLYRVIGYRKKVVYENIKNSFPHKTESELKQIEKDFYQYLVDLFMETLKTLTISKEEAKRRCLMTEHSQQLFNHFHEKNNRV